MAWALHKGKENIVEGRGAACCKPVQMLCHRDTRLSSLGFGFISLPTLRDNFNS